MLYKKESLWEYIQDKQATFIASSYTLAIIYLSITPNDFIAQHVSVFDPKKIVLHFFSYAFLSYLWFRSVKNYKTPIFIALFIGILTETLQIFIPSRFFDPLDMLANICGSLFLMSIIYIKNSL